MDFSDVWESFCSWWFRVALLFSTCPRTKVERPLSPLGHNQSRPQLHQVRGVHLSAFPLWAGVSMHCSNLSGWAPDRALVTGSRAFMLSRFWVGAMHRWVLNISAVLLLFAATKGCSNFTEPCWCCRKCFSSFSCLSLFSSSSSFFCLFLMQRYSNRLATNNWDHDGEDSLKKYHELIIFCHARLYHLSGLQWEPWPSSLTMCTLMVCSSIILLIRHRWTTRPPPCLLKKVHTVVRVIISNYILVNYQTWIIIAEPFSSRDRCIFQMSPCGLHRAISRDLFIRELLLLGIHWDALGNGQPHSLHWPSQALQLARLGHFLLYMPVLRGLCVSFTWVTTVLIYAKPSFSYIPSLSSSSFTWSLPPRSQVSLSNLSDT